MQTYFACLLKSLIVPVWKCTRFLKCTRLKSLNVPLNVPVWVHVPQVGNPCYRQNCGYSRNRYRRILLYFKGYITKDAYLP